jgi:hypothetical protein
MTENQTIQQQTPYGLSEALLQVRKAYRLLWHYQDHVYDILQTIVEEFKNIHYYFSDFKRPGNSSTNPLDRDVWYMLPMFEMCLFYLNDGSTHDDPTSYPQRGDYLLDFQLISDTGRDPSWRERDPRRFKPAECCESQLSLCIFVNKLYRTERANWYYQIWTLSTYPDHNQALEHNRVPGVYIYRYEFNLTELFDKDAIIDCVRQFKQNVKAVLSFDVDTRTFG